MPEDDEHIYIESVEYDTQMMVDVLRPECSCGWKSHLTFTFPKVAETEHYVHRKLVAEYRNAWATLEDD